MKVKTLIATACALVASASASAAVPSFAITKFVTTPYSYVISNGSLSENGLVAFSGITGFVDGDAVFTTFKSTGVGGQTQIVAPTTSDYFARPSGINNSGTVVISTSNLTPDPRYGNAINNLGQVVDSTSLITPGAATVNILAPQAGSLVDVNDAGQVLGNLGQYSASHGAFIYSNGSSQSLSSGTYNKAVASHLSSNGYVAGTVSTGNTSVGAIWMNGNLTTLSNFDTAVDINRWGVAVGNKGPSYQSVGLLWVNGTSYKLDDLISTPLPDQAFQGWTIGGVAGINDKGQILALAQNINGDSILVKLDPTAPVPEPETYAMLLGGLGVIGFAARRRRAAVKAS
jgi:hypothetical protein